MNFFSVNLGGHQPSAISHKTGTGQGFRLNTQAACTQRG